MDSLVRKSMSFLVSVIIISMFLCNSLVYATEVSTHMNSNKEDIIQNIGYIFAKDSIEEKAVLKINDEFLYIDTIVYRSGSYKQVISNDKGTEKTIFGTTGYEEFNKVATAYNENLVRGKKDLKGKQFKHQEIGSNSFTIDRDEIVNMTDGLVGLTAAISSYLGVPAATAIATAVAGIVHLVAVGDPDYVEVNVTVYEVLLTHDNSYYTHCYHSVAKSYRYGKLYKTQRDYTQIVGG